MCCVVFLVVTFSHPQYQYVFLISWFKGDIIGGHVILKLSVLTSDSLNHRTEKFEDQKAQILIPSKSPMACLGWLDYAWVC